MSIDIEKVRARLIHATGGSVAPDILDALDEVERLQAEAEWLRGERFAWMERTDRLRAELDEVGQRSTDRMLENHRLGAAVDAVKALAEKPNRVKVHAGGGNLVTDVPIVHPDLILAALDEHLGERDA